MLSACCSSTILPLSYLQAYIVLISRVWDCWVPVAHIFYQNRCRCRGYQRKWRNRAQVGVRRGTWSLLCFFSWWSVVEPSWDDRGYSIWGYLILIWILTVVGLCVYFGWCMNNIYVLCEVAIVSQLSLSHSCSLHGIVWRWPFLRLNHNAVMPLSRASTRGRYSRIMGVTSW